MKRMAAAFMTASTSSTLSPITTVTNTTVASMLASTSTTPVTEGPHPQDMQESHQKLHALSPVDRPNPLTAVCPRPIPNSYWAAPLLLACEYPWCPTSCDKLDHLLLAGVRTFIDLTEAGELLPYYSILNSRASLLHVDTTSPNQEIEYHRFPIKDRCIPSSLSQIHAIMKVLTANHERGRICAVHCRGGIGRTGLVIGCYLVHSGLAENGEEALNIIATEWKGVEKCTRFPHSPETGDQEAFVRNWKGIGSALMSRGIAGVGSGICVFGGVAPASATVGRHK